MLYTNQKIKIGSKASQHNFDDDVQSPFGII